MSLNNLPASPLGKNNIPQSPGVNEPSSPRPGTPGTNSPNNPSSRPNTPGLQEPPNTPGLQEPPKVNTSGKKSATKYLENVKQEDTYIESLKQQAQDAWKIRGALCDSEGFYQHTGECWNDAIQQILCNADGIKEVVQSIYIFWTFDTENYKQMPDYYFIPRYFRYPGAQERFLSENKEWVDELKKWMNLYFRESQKRFLRHYLLETKRRTLKQELCAIEGSELGEVAREKIRAISMNPEFRKAGAEAQQSAIFGKYKNIVPERETAILKKREIKLKPTRAEYIAKNLAGGTTEDEDYIFNMYNDLFFRNGLTITTINMRNLQSVNKEPIAFKRFLDSVTGIHFGIEDVVDGNSGHALAFYQCGNQELFYEDNYGIFPFKWRQCILKFLELMQIYPDTTMRFTKIQFQNKARNLFFHTEFYPVISYSDEKGNPHMLLLLDDSFVEANLESKDSFRFQTELNGTTILLQYNNKKAMVLTRFMYIQPSSSIPIRNTAFELNTVSRIQTNSIPDNILEVNPIIDSILEADEEGALEAIDKEKVNPDLFYISEDKEVVPVVILALRSNFRRVVIKLIEKGYRTKPLTPGQDSALKEAIIYKETDIVEALIRSDPSLISFPDTNDEDPLIFASKNDKYLPSIKLLVEAGANIETQNKFGETPLFIASSRGALETVKYLCSKGANPFAKDKSTKHPETPIDVAKTPEIKEILQTQCGKAGGRRRRKTRRVQRKRAGKKTRRQ